MEADRRELERDLAEALERQAATEQVLEVLGRCAFELEPVFETVAWFTERNPKTYLRVPIEVRAPRQPYTRPTPSPEVE